MGYAPDWNKGSMKKSGATPVKHGVTSRELFHGAKAVRKYADGGEVEYANPAAAAAEPVELNIRGEKVGKYEGNDEIVKYRMNMTDDVGGKSLRYKDNPDAMPMPEKRPYDSIDAILDDKSSYGKKAEDKDLVGDVIKAVKSSNTPRASSITPARATAPKAKDTGPAFSDDARSPDQVAEPYRPMHNEAEGNYEQLRQPTRRSSSATTTVDKNNRVRLSGRSTPSTPAEAPKPGSLRDTLRVFREGMAETRR